MLLVYWILQSLKHRGSLNFGIALNKRQILFLVLSEMLLFSILFLLYYLNQDPDTANSFAWQNMFLYFRGILPVIALNSLAERTFRFLSNPTWECLIAVLIIDYIALLITSRF
jgi:hypothetical protein